MVATNTSKAHNAKVNGGRHEMNLVKLIERFGSEDRCRDYLETLRWPEGVACPECGGTSISRIKTRNQYDCNACRNRFSVKSGTALHDSHLPLWKWFLATYMMIESRKGISANQLKRTLGITYKTAWFLCHRIRWAMGDQPPEPLEGIVEVDETFIGGKTSYAGGMREKTMVLGAIERDGRVVFQVSDSPTPKRHDLHQFVKQVVADDAEAIYTDGLPSYEGIGTDTRRHETVSHSQEEWVRGDVGTQNIENVWSLLDRSIVGSFHQLSVKHLPAYLDELSFRFNNRENPFLFRDTLIALLRSDGLTYDELVAD
ncbi:MAG TPA: IS1595 family transposase [Actinomycetota bacterium]|nr:IS1595 family transposase [Actinomycetota bacterium]